MFVRRWTGRAACARFVCRGRGQFFDRSTNVVYIQHYQRMVWSFGNIALNYVTIALNRTGVRGRESPVATGQG